jgi:hypothetical protein
MRPIIGFRDHELEEEVPNEKLTLLVVATIADHDVSKILIDEGSLRDIIDELLASVQKSSSNI